MPAIALASRLRAPARIWPSAPGATKITPRSAESCRLRSAPPVVVTVTAAPPVTVPLPPAVLPAPPPPEASAVSPRVRIVAVEQQRLPAPGAFEDLRLLHITIAPAAGNVPAPASVSVKTEFFDEDEYAGHIAPTEALPPRAELHPDEWRSETPVTVTASYAVPAGLRDRQLLAGRKVRYAGYRIRVYVDGALQTAETHPRWLLEGRP